MQRTAISGEHGFSPYGPDVGWIRRALHKEDRMMAAPGGLEPVRDRAD